MCLALPVRIEALLDDDMARVTLAGVSTEVSVALLDAVDVGDYVVIHVGYALSRLDPDEAERTIAMIRDAAEAGLADPALAVS